MKELIKQILSNKQTIEKIVKVMEETVWSHGRRTAVYINEHGSVTVGILQLGHTTRKEEVIFPYAMNKKQIKDFLNFILEVENN